MRKNLIILKIDLNQNSFNIQKNEIIKQDLFNN